jgi:hypothetical protein
MTFWNSLAGSKTAFEKIIHTGWYVGQQNFYRRLCEHIDTAAKNRIIPSKINHFAEMQFFVTSTILNGNKTFDHQNAD